MAMYHVAINKVSAIFLHLIQHAFKIVWSVPTISVGCAKHVAAVIDQKLKAWVAPLMSKLVLPGGCLLKDKAWV